jgi:hypothetical protein
MVLVFKTTVDTQGEARKLKPHLDELLMPVKWNFDLSDCDRILRVEGPDEYVNTCDSYIAGSWIRLRRIGINISGMP